MSNYHADWMKNANGSIGGKKLNQLFLPGSHDSATFALGDELGLDSDPQVLKIFETMGSIPFIGSIASNVTSFIIKRWSACQSVPLGEQLKYGVRYLDLRVTVDDGKFYFVHTLRTSSTVRELLVPVKDFVNAHDGEIVILDFQHFYDLNKEDHVRFYSMLKDLFGDKLAPFDYRNKSVSEYLSAHKRVVVIYGDDAPMPSKDNKTGNGSNELLKEHKDLWPRGPSIESIWVDKNRLDDLVQAMDEVVSKRNENDDRLHVLQGCMTAHPDDIKSAPQSTLKAFGAEVCNGTVCEKFSQVARSGRKPWIFLLDHVEIQADKFITSTAQANK